MSTTHSIKGGIDGITHYSYDPMGNLSHCTDVSSSYISGIAACNSTCDGYNTSVCENDGW